MELKVIGHIENDYIEKFGIPRQSGLVNEVVSKIIFEPEYRTWDAFKGIEGYTYIWLLWEFSKCKKENWSATVKPPRLGGNQRVGVFATRSPFRPNSIGLSSVKLEKIEHDDKLGTVLYVSGADLMNGTPIFDIKPYVEYADSHPGVKSGFADEVKEYALEVDFPQKLKEKLDDDTVDSIIQILSQDPRPSYIEDEEREYGVAFGKWNIKFRVKNGKVYIFAMEDYKNHKKV